MGTERLRPDTGPDAYLTPEERELLAKRTAADGTGPWNQELLEGLGAAAGHGALVAGGGEVLSEVLVAPELRGRQLEIHLGHICNNICSFCSSGQFTQERIARPQPLEPVLRALEAGRAQGATKVTFLGGEPTIQRSFFPALEAAFALGYPEVVVFTNLVRGRERKFLERAAATGPCHWRVSVQGGDAQTHDRVVGRSGAFARIESGMDWLAASGQELSVNACITSENAGSIPGYLDLVRRYPLKHLHLDMLRPASMGHRSEDYVRSQLPEYSDVALQLGLLLDGVDAFCPGFEIIVGNFPFCMLPRHAHRITYGGEDTLHVSAAEDGGGRVWDKYAYQESCKVLAESCGECVFRPRCRGVPAGYARKHGLGGLSPIGSGHALGLDRRSRQFLQYGSQVGRPGREDLPKEMERLAGMVALLSRGSPYHGWSYFRYLLLPEQGRAVVRMRMDGRHFDVHLHASPLRISFDPDPGTEPVALKAPVRSMLQALGME
jgi:MoaA/NifB/PqqE/SkfB family radical SAM enzyme